MGTGLRGSGRKQERVTDASIWSISDSFSARRYSYSVTPGSASPAAAAVPLPSVSAAATDAGAESKQRGLQQRDQRWRHACLSRAVAAGRPATSRGPSSGKRVHRGGLSPGADVARVSPVLVQMWPG